MGRWRLNLDKLGNSEVEVPHHPTMKQYQKIARKLLKFTLSAAICDGMTHMKLIFIEECTTLEMWFGFQGASQVYWWEMKAPPPQLYLHCLLALQRDVTLEDAWPPIGMLSVRFQGVDHLIRVELPSLNELVLNWNIAPFRRQLPNIPDHHQQYQ